MLALIVLFWLGFQGLAICALGGMTEMGFTPGEAIAAAAAVAATGGMVTRAMYHKAYTTTRKAGEAPAYMVSRELQASFI